MPGLLLLVTDLEIGGTPTVVRELATRLHKRGHRIAVACLGRRGPVADQIAAAGIEVTALGALGAWDLRILPRLLTLLRTGKSNCGSGFQPVHNPLSHRERVGVRALRAGVPSHESPAAAGFDTVLSFLIHANALAAIACALTGTRLLQSIQTTQPQPRWHWALQRLIAPLAERIIVPSQSVADAARDWSGIAPSQIQIIPNAIDPADFNITPLPVSAPAHIGFIGRLDSIKLIPVLLEATMVLNLALRKTHLHIFGDGPEHGRLRQQIDRMGAGDFITHHGAIARPQDALQRISLLVLPSKAEGFGLVLIEAMAAGIPIVATNAPGIRDVVQHDHTGILVAINSPAELAFAIRRLLDDAPLRNRLVAAARLDVAARFSWSTVLPSYEGLLYPER